jgi:PKD repeat protein
VSTNNTSSAGSQAAYFWDYGNGNTSANFNSFNIYSQPGTYNISLVVTEVGGCADTAYASITADPSPQADILVSDTSGCMPLTIAFTSLSQFTDSLFWDLGDGIYGNDSAFVHTYAANGTYSPSLIATNDFGCSDTLEITDINVLLTPDASFIVNQPKVCFGETFEFTNSTSPSQNVGYLWNIGGLITSAPEPQVTLPVAGIFNVTLIATHSNGCADTLTEPYYLQVYDSVPPPVSPILSVSVIDDNSIEIIWQNSASLDLGEYRLYRLNDFTGLYELIHADSSPANSNISVTSTYTDAGLNTLENTYSYKLQTVDQCNNSRSLNSSVPHTSINVTATRVGQDINVSWTPYQGCVVNSYEVTRTEVSSGATTVIATVPSVVRSVMDSGFYCPDDFIYRIRATGLCGSLYDSWSDTSAVTPANLLTSQKVDIVRTTVINDSETLTEWLPPVIAPERVIGYEIFRSEDGGPYVPVASMSPLDLSYIDYDVDVMRYTYMYRVNVLNDCNLTGLISDKGTSILLRSEVMELGDKLWWSDYEHWDTGVEHYIIEIQDENGQWLPVKKVDGNVNTILIK